MIALFQSLSGFLMRCDRGPGRAGPGDAGFQSLSGFLMRCDMPNLAHTLLHDFRVSIPIGFSDAL